MNVSTVPPSVITAWPMCTSSVARSPDAVAADQPPRRAIEHELRHPVAVADDLPARVVAERRPADHDVEPALGRILLATVRRSSPPGSCRRRRAAGSRRSLLVVEAERVTHGDARLLHRRRRERRQADHVARREDARHADVSEMPRRRRPGPARRSRPRPPRDRGASVLPTRPAVTSTFSVGDLGARGHRADEGVAAPSDGLGALAEVRRSRRASAIPAVIRSTISASRNGRSGRRALDQVHLGARAPRTSRRTRSRSRRRRARRATPGSRSISRMRVGVVDVGVARTGCPGGRNGLEPVAIRITSATSVPRTPALVRRPRP